jgi:hypothetical protein
MVTNFDLTINKSNGLWTINFVVNGDEIFWSGDNEKEVLTLYHTLAKVVNKTFGTDFVYSEGGLCDYYFNIQKSNYGEIYNLFVRDRKDTIDYRVHTLGTYKDPHIYVPKEDIIEITRLFGEWLSNNDIHKMTYDVLKKDWLFHIGIGIGAKLDTFYKDLYEVDVDFSEESIRQLRNEKGKEILDKASEKALTLRKCDESYIKFEFENIRNNGLTFYIYNGVDSYILRFPRLDEMKKNEDFIKKLKVYVYNEKVDEWVNSECDLPNFSIDNFLLCEGVANVQYFNK